MDSNRQAWNQEQKTLRRLLTSGDDHPAALSLFLKQHAAVHAASVAGAGLWSFEDEVWQGLSDAAARRIPEKFEHSVVWVIWHLARIEDAAMSVLLGGRTQVLLEEDWLERLQAPNRTTGNLMRLEEIAQLSAAIDIPSLRAYRAAVGRQTRAIVQDLQPADLKQKVAPERLRQLADEGVVPPEAFGLLDYWGGLTHAGLMLMPPTRHNFIHLNEAKRIKAKVSR